MAVSPGRSLVLLVDGLGHGLAAADAAREAVATFHNHAHRSPKPRSFTPHTTRLRKTRGAAAAVALVDHERGGVEVRYCGVGNIAAVVVMPEEVRKCAHGLA